MAPNLTCWSSHATLRDEPIDTIFSYDALIWCILRSTVVFLLAVLGVVSVGMAHASLPDNVQIGILLPHTGSLHSSGVLMQAAMDMAVADFNAYLEENDIRWRIMAVSEDTGTDPDTTLEKIKKLHDGGINIIIGPGGSGQLASIMNYTNENNMLVISPGSTAPSLAISDDAIYRTVSDDLTQGRAFGAIMWHDDIRAIVPIWRGDVYGDDLVGAAVADFVERGGVAYPGVRYDASSGAFDESISELASVIDGVVAEHGAGHTAVLVVAFDEVVDLLRAASGVDILRDVRWVSNEPAIQSGVQYDMALSEFVTDARLVTIQQFFSLTERGYSIQATLTERFGATPTVFVYPAYDAVWLAGLSVLEAGDTNPANLRRVIHDVAASGINGTLDSTVLNEAGDLEKSQVNFEARALIGDKWVPGYKYYGSIDTVVSECQVEVIIKIQNGFSIISDTLTYPCSDDDTGTYVYQK